MVVYRQIEAVGAEPQYGNSGPPGWGFTLWNKSMDAEPHRRLLENFAARYPECALDLPEYVPHEDCIEGTMIWQSQGIWIWYEAILTHLRLWSSDRAAIESLRAALLPLAQAA